MKEFFLSAFWLVFFLWLIGAARFFRNSGLSTRTLRILFGVKILFGFALYLIYAYYYPYRNNSDAFKYYDDAQVVYSALHDNPRDYFQIITGINGDSPHLDKYYVQMETWFQDKTYRTFNDNHNIVRINAVVAIFSFGVYFVHILFFCFLSFCGLTALSRFIKHYSSHSIETVSLLTFLPLSVLFWSSAVLKESLVFFALGMFLFYFQKILNRFSILTLLLALFFMFTLALVKTYVFLSLVPAILFLILVEKSGTKKPILYFVIVTILSCSVVLFLFSRKGPQSLLSTLSAKQKDFINLGKGGSYFINCYSRDTIYVAPDEELKIKTKDSIRYALGAGATYHHWTYWKILDTVHVTQDDTTCYQLYGNFGKTGSSFELTELQPNLGSFLKLVPEALRNVFFRPLVSEIRSPLIALSFAENLFYLLLMTFFLMKFRQPGDQELTFIFFAILFTIPLATLIGIITPVTGAIVRYRVPFLPFLLCCFLLLSEPIKINRFIPSWLKKKGS